MEFLPYVSLFIGLFARVFVPWLAKRRIDPDKYAWQWKLLWPQLLAFGLVLMVLPLVIGDLTMIQDLGPQAAWLIGWGAADVGSQTYKAFAKDEL